MGADRDSSDLNYIPVRSSAMPTERILEQRLNRAVFEPNDEQLWAKIKEDVAAFMHELFRNGAFAGLTPQEAHVVKCDADTTRQIDIDMGIVNILVGFAPLRPGEFVIIRIQQVAGQRST